MKTVELTDEMLVKMVELLNQELECIDNFEDDNTEESLNEQRELLFAIGAALTTE